MISRPIRTMSVLCLVGFACLAPGLGACSPGPNSAPPSHDPAPPDDPAPRGQPASDTSQSHPDTTLLGLGPKHGEYGLWARFDGDTLRINWITRAPGQGLLEVVAEDGSRAPPGRIHSTGVAHAAALELVPGESVRLHYGAAADPEDRHETTIRRPRADERPPVGVQGLDSLYVIGDIHGEYDNMVKVLRNAGLIDADLRWSGGTHHLVVLGDMMSRGAHSTAVLWFLYRLEQEAAAAGGRVHIVLGNHEFLVILDDLRYVQSKESRIAELHGTPYHRMYDPRHSVLGRWLMTKPVAIQVDDVVLAHGGLGSEYLPYTLEALDDSLATWVAEESFYRWADDAYWEDPDLVLPVDSVGWDRRLDFFFEPESPIWHRDYAQTDTAGDELDQVLERFEARIHVIAHTPIERMHQQYGGRVILTNTFPFAAEVLLLTRDPEGQDGWARHRIGFEGPPEPLETFF